MQWMPTMLLSRPHQWHLLSLFCIWHAVFLIFCLQQAKEKLHFSSSSAKGTSLWAGFLPRFPLKTVLGVSGRYNMPFSTEEVVWPCWLTVFWTQDSGMGVSHGAGACRLCGDKVQAPQQLTLWQAATSKRLSGRNVCQMKLISFCRKVRDLKAGGRKQEVTGFIQWFVRKEPPQSRDLVRQLLHHWAQSAPARYFPSRWMLHRWWAT